MKSSKSSHISEIFILTFPIYWKYLYKFFLYIGNIYTNSSHISENFILTFPIYRKYLYKFFLYIGNIYKFAASFE